MTPSSAALHSEMRPVSLIEGPGAWYADKNAEIFSQPYTRRFVVLKSQMKARRMRRWVTRELQD